MYEIHWRGVVRNAITKENLVPGLTKCGYLTVALYKDGKRLSQTVHRLNAIHHIPNPENKRCVNHDNGRKTSNHIANLEWATHKENNQHATETGLRYVKCTPSIVSQILSMHIRGDKLYGAKGLSKIFNVNKSTIHDILNKHNYGNRN